MPSLNPAASAVVAGDLNPDDKGLLYFWMQF
jgi:hypothetical protein